MTQLDHIDCQGLGGAWTLGSAQAGFRLVHRASLGGFGDRLVEANRALLPGPWEQDGAGSSGEWEPAEAPYLTGTPPCSGFSLLNKTGGVANKRGADSAINDCMWELVAYASRCRGSDGAPGPEVVAFESVQGAFKQGRGLMQALRDRLSANTGQRYALTHVLMSGASVGAAQMRHRYYFVAHRVPFGVHAPEPRPAATYGLAIGDLAGLADDSWDPQVVFRHGDTSWLDEFGILKPFGPGTYEVADHIAVENQKVGILRELSAYWEPGENLAAAMKRYHDANGRVPAGSERWWDEAAGKLKYEIDLPKRVRPERLGYVLTGDCVVQHVHWSQPRTLTVREAARLMGYPDAWRFDSCSSPQAAGRFIGKCCPVQSGRWISSQVRESLLGNPGPDQTALSDDEFVHDSTAAYRNWMKAGLA